ncbi:MAG: hypothetical protein FJ309_09235 [Planctomycetes bacterium]|nr:hypothetical protein [Planctomycetota bacterium]
MTRPPSPARRRAGITILEVLIAIGILAIGLSSILALIPLGRSLLTKAIVADHSGVLLDNARATVVTSGLTHVDALAAADGGPCPAAPLVIDPLGQSRGTWPARFGLNTAVLRAGGTLADRTPDSARPRSWQVSALTGSSSDDVLMTTPDGDTPVTNRFVNGVRAAAGRFSWLAVLAKDTATPLVPGELATLWIVVSRNRVLGLMPPEDGNATALELRLTPRGPDGARTSLPPYRLAWQRGRDVVPDRLDREVVKKGAILLVLPSGPEEDPYRPPRFLSLATVTFPDAAAGAPSEAEVTFEGDPSPVGESSAGDPAEPRPVSLPVAILPDATAVRAYTVTIEGRNEYTR